MSPAPMQCCVKAGTLSAPAACAQGSSVTALSTRGNVSDRLARAYPDTPLYTALATPDRQGGAGSRGWGAGSTAAVHVCFLLMLLCRLVFLCTWHRRSRNDVWHIGTLCRPFPIILGSIMLVDTPQVLQLGHGAAGGGAKGSP